VGQEVTNGLRFESKITVNPVQQVGGDAMVAAAAWASTSGATGMAKAAAEPDKIAGLISFLMKHRHGTPFEHGLMTFVVHAPIFVWREWHRHRIAFSYSEESGRYKTLEPVFYLPPFERPMAKVDDWKPGRPKFLKLDQGDAAAYKRFNRLCGNLQEVYELSYRNYLRNLELDIDPGLARACLPVGIYSTCWVTCNPRSLMAFLSLRTHEPDAKFVSYPLYEIEVAARAVEDIFASGWPLTYKAFVDNGRTGP
jgi:thymidylate synthase (FAD)